MTRETVASEGRPEPDPFRQLLVVGAFLQAGKTLTSPHLLLPWVMVTLGAPNVLVALVLPLWRAARVATRLLLAAWIDARATLRPVILLSLGTRMATLAAMAIVLAAAEGPASYIVVIAGALAFGAADGVGMVTGKRLTSKAVERRRVGRLVSQQAALGGVVTLGLIGVHVVLDPPPETSADFLVHLAMSAFAFAIAFFAAVLLRERVEQPDAARTLALRFPDFSLLRADRWLRHYTAASVVGQTISLAPSFFAMIIARDGGQPEAVLVFIAAQMVGGALGGMAWSKLVPGRSDRVAQGAFGLLAVATIVAMVAELDHAWGSALVFAPVFILSGAANAGYRAVESHALVGGAEARRIASTFAVANAVTSAVGIALAFGLGLVAHTIFEEAALGLMVGLQLLGAVLWTGLLRRPPRRAE